MIDILIPTYNRSPSLIKNITLLDAQLESASLNGKFRILVSNNCSTDDTSTALERIKKRIKVDLKTYEQASNIGLERNAIFLLSKAEAEYIIYLGDDDFLPNGYLQFIIETIDNDPEVSSIIPGFSECYPDGSVLLARQASFEVKKYSPCFKTAIDVSNFGHQLSGLFLKRDRLAEKYLYNESLRNIYPFIFFVAFNNLQGSTYYAPKFKVLVSQGNSKDWQYDDSGLLVEILKNYQILYPNSPLYRLLLSWSFASKQPWRLRIDLHKPWLALNSFMHIIRTDSVDKPFKLSLIIFYPYTFSKQIISRLKKMLHKIKL